LCCSLAGIVGIAQQPETAATLAFLEGPAVDRDGNVYFVDIPEDPITNNAFGGPDMKALYVTAGKTLYRVRTEIAGLPR
jgi:sugar lactone lactonase YvrE